MKQTFFEELKVRAYEAANATNYCADNKDTNRNHVSYGQYTAWIRMIGDMGHRTNLAVWEDDNGCLRIPFIEIDGEKWTEFKNGN